MGRSITKLILVSVVVCLTCMLPVSAFGQVEELYQSQCASCHAADGSASTPAGKKMQAADLRSKEVQRLSNEELFDGIAYGVKHKKYPHAFARRGLTTRQIADLVVFIRKLPAQK
jgi:mono/diheme cytochrome c family protein